MVVNLPNQSLKNTKLYSFRYQIAERFVLWDIAGCSTENYQAGEFGEEYISDFSLAFFNMIVLTTSSRETEIAATIYKNIKQLKSEKYNPKIIIVRSKIDEVTLEVVRFL